VASNPEPLEPPELLEPLDPPDPPELLELTGFWYPAGSLDPHEEGTNASSTATLDVTESARRDRTTSRFIAMPFPEGSRVFPVRKAVGSSPD
jgi:hypothetical protein